MALFLRNELLLRRSASSMIAEAYNPRRFRNKAVPLRQRNSTSPSSAQFSNIGGISTSTVPGVANSRLIPPHGTNGGITDPSLESIAADLTPNSVGRWVDRFGTAADNPQLDDNSFKVISYNVLGPLHGESSKHDYAPVSVTKWTRRRDKLNDELRAMQADVLCLQEVTEKGLAETFIPGLRRIGMECAGFAPMQQRSRHNAARGKMAHKNIGCAVFVNPAKIEVLSSKRVHLHDFAALRQCNSPMFFADIQSKFHSMVMTMIRLKATNQVAIIGNTHLYWNPMREDIKVVQTHAAACALSRFAKEMGFAEKKGDMNKQPEQQQQQHQQQQLQQQQQQSTPPLILCGDFNTNPQMGYTDQGIIDSAVFEMLRTGKVSITHPQHPDVWYPALQMSRENPRLGDLKIDWTLQNIYDVDHFRDFAPLFSTKTDDFQGWIDHIWVSDSVQVEMVMNPPIRRGDLEANIKSRSFPPLPNKDFASDHLPLGLVAKLL